MRLACLALLLGPTLALAQPAPPQNAPPPGNDLELAKAHFATGELYYERGRYPDAAREFEEAYRLSQRPELLYNMGKSYDGIGDHARALAAYRRFLNAVVVSPDRAQVTDRAKQLQLLVGVVTIKASVDGSAVTIDGLAVGTTPLAEALELNPGAHKMEIVHEGFATWRGDVTAAPGAQQTVNAEQISLVKVIRVEVPEKKVPIYKRWWLWTAVGVVIAAGAVTAGVLVSQQPPVAGPFAVLPKVQ
jgi:PEGA domain/Tetratricopeptide repeat